MSREEEQQPIEQKRGYFRVQYPLKERPKLSIGLVKFSVLDISEKGLRIKIEENDTITIMSPLAAKIVLGPDSFKSFECSMTIQTGYRYTIRPKQKGILKDIPSPKPKPKKETDEDTEKTQYPTLELYDMIYDKFTSINDSIEFIDSATRILKYLPDIKSKIYFLDGDHYPLLGKFIRIKYDEAVLLLSETIPYKKIIKEQLRLIKKYSRI